MQKTVQTREIGKLPAGSDHKTELPLGGVGDSVQNVFCRHPVNSVAFRSQTPKLSMSPQIVRCLFSIYFIGADHPVQA